MRSIITLVFLLGFPFLLFGVSIYSQEVDYERQYNLVDCFFIVVCDLDEADRIPELFGNTSEKVVNEFYNLHKKNVVNVVSREDYLDEMAWKTSLKYSICNMTDTEKRQGIQSFAIEFGEYTSSACSDDTRQDECKDIEKVVTSYYKLYEEKMEKEQCLCSKASC